MDNRNTTFNYTYSAAQQEEIEKIRQKYTLQEKSEADDKMEQLRALDAGVTKKAIAVALTEGIICTLVFGFGMSCVLLWGTVMFIPGIIIGIVGLIGAVMAYPVYKKITAKERERIAPQIFLLTEALTAGSTDNSVRQ